MKYMTKKRFSTIQVVGLLTMALLGVVAIGYAVDFAHDFSQMTGQVISGTEVMDNFNSLNAALPIMASSIDNTPLGETCDNCPITEVNSVTIDVPADGFLLINGSCFVQNVAAADMIFIAVPKLDGVDIQASFAAAERSVGENLRFTLSYTVAVAVSQGVHTISQDVGPISSSLNFFYNFHNLTVVYYPTGQGSIMAEPVGLAVPARQSTSSPFGD